MPFIESETWRVIDSGVAIPMNGRSAIIEVSGLGKLEFIFENLGESRIDIDPVPGGATIKITGVSASTIGAGLKSTIEFGSIQGKKVRANFRWQGLSEGHPLLVYAFYLEP